MTRIAPAGALPAARPAAHGWSLVALADWRASAYRVCAALLLHPDEQRLQWLSHVARAFRQYDDALAAFAFFGPWHRLLDLLEDIERQDRAALQAEHVRLFSLDPCATPCLPYESFYLMSGHQETGWVTVQLQGTYARAGLHLAPSLNESPDHAAVELEFMSYLCRQEAEAWERADSDAAIGAIEQERAFLHLHLGRWFGQFARNARARTAVQFYALAVEAADAFVCHERDLVGSLAHDARPLRTHKVPLTHSDIPRPGGQRP